MTARRTLGVGDFFRWEIFSVVVPGLCVALLGMVTTTEWLPHNFLIAEVLLAPSVLCRPFN